MLYPALITIKAIMNKITCELNNKHIEKLGTEAITDFYKTMAIDTLTLPGLNSFATGDDSPFLNVVIDTRDNQKINDETIQQISCFFEHHHISWGWFITDSNKSENIEQHGFQLIYETPSMYFDLLNDLPKIAKSDVDIRNADDELLEWIKPLQDGFPSNDNCEV